MESMIGILLLATLIEGTVQYFFGEGEYTRPYLKYVALVLGVGAAVAYKVDIPAMAGLVTAYPYVNYAISGIIIGRGSNYINDIVSLIRGRVIEE